MRVVGDYMLNFIVKLLDLCLNSVKDDFIDTSSPYFKSISLKTKMIIKVILLSINFS